MALRRMAFGEFAEIQPKVKLEKGTDYSFIEMADVEPHVKHVKPGELRSWKGSGGAKFQDGDVIFARITPCLEHGKTARVSNLTDSRGFGSTEFFVFRARNGTSDPDYVYYIARSPIIREPAIKSMTGASGRQRAQMTVVENILVPAPPLSEQVRIASTLSTYDDLIENNRRRVQLLEEATRLLYKEWFFHLRFPGHEHAKITDGVPEGWELKQVKDLLAKVKRPGKIQKTDYLSDGPIPCIDQSREFIGGYTENKDAIIDDLPMIIFGDHTRILKFIDFPFACGADGTQLISSNDPKVSQEYLYFALDANDLSNYFYARHFKFLKDQYIPRPTDIIVEQFTNVARPIMYQIKILRQQNYELSKGRDLLLPRLMSGEVTV